MVLTAICLLTSLDYVPPRVIWPGRTVGYIYLTDPPYPGHQYPILNMLDGDPKTAWMVGGRRVYLGDGKGFGSDSSVSAPPKIYVEFREAMSVEGIRIMPGYNKSPEVFQRNNRITKVAVYGLESGAYSYPVGVPIATSSFKDEMGWKDVRFTPRNLSYIVIEVMDWIKGRDNDFCVSELQLLSDGKPVDWQLTPMLLSSPADPEWNVVTQDGTIVRSAGNYDFGNWATDPSQRYVFSYTLTKNYFQFYVLDMVKGRFVAHADRSRNPDRAARITEVEWKPGQAVGRIGWSIVGDKHEEETITLRWPTNP